MQKSNSSGLKYMWLVSGVVRALNTEEYFTDTSVRSIDYLNEINILAYA